MSGPKSSGGVTHGLWSQVLSWVPNSLVPGPFRGKDTAPRGVHTPLAMIGVPSQDTRFTPGLVMLWAVRFLRSCRTLVFFCFLLFVCFFLQES